MKKNTEISIAFFVTPHGFGHAARASAVMNAILERLPNVSFHIFSRVPSWFFEDSHVRSFEVYDTLTDIGMVQKSPLEHDLDETLEKLNAFIPFEKNKIDALSQTILKKGCRLVICDISPLGIAVAKKAGIPSVLIENFTWDWIYEYFLGDKNEFEFFIRYLKNVFESADIHIRAKPSCQTLPAELSVNPIARKVRSHPLAVREKLQIPENKNVVLATMGGVAGRYDYFHKLSEKKNIFFVIPGGSDAFEYRENMILTPHRSTLYHPDMINAADAVVGKVGYSTLAEVYRSGVPYGCVLRNDFRETPFLESFVRENLSHVWIENGSFLCGDWVNCLDELVGLPRKSPAKPNGADQVAEFIRKRFVER